MDPRVAQMISDAIAVVDGAIAAGDELATHDVRMHIDPVRAGEPSNYKGTWVREMDLLGIYLPNTGTTSRNRQVMPVFGR